MGCVDANFRFFLLGQNCTYKTINIFRSRPRASHPHDEFGGGGGGFSRRTSDAKVRFLREKCLENLENFCKRVGIEFWRE